MHGAISCKVRVALKLQRGTEAGEKLLRTDHSSLNDKEVIISFCHSVIANLKPTDDASNQCKNLSGAMQTAAAENQQLSLPLLGMYMKM